MGDYTADQLEAGVHIALKAQDVKAAVDILKVLISVDMDRALRLHGQLNDALAVARALRGDDA